MSELERIALAALLALLYAAFTVFCYWRHGRKRLPGRGATGRGDCIIAYASQSGRAHALAEQTLSALHGNAELINLNQLDEEKLLTCQRLLLVASTYGDGEAPDNGAAFAARFIRSSKPLDLSHLRVSVLALGDSHYADYCRFGRQLHAWSIAAGAQELAPLIELDATNPAAEHLALQSWHRMLANLGGEFSVASAEITVMPVKQILHLTERECLNSGSPWQGLYRLALQARDSRLQFSAGDIADVYPRQDPQRCSQLLDKLALAPESVLACPEGPQTAIEWLATREWQDHSVPTAGANSDAVHHWLLSLPVIQPRQYTIACASCADRMELVVRQQYSADGHLGLASGFLTQQAPLATEVTLAIRDNSEFHTPPSEQPIILIGNGSGIAGLRAHLQHRANTGGEACWLIYGERDPATDRPFDAELNAWQVQGVIERLDRVFSRNTAQAEYVQQKLAQCGELLHQWLKRGACIYVCGSRIGMGQGVHEVLTELLSENTLTQLQAEGRYRRDVY
ncbi:flavodoxin domain-containing protein [Gilvimarinus xylanilyticus]|uniref:NADPH--hemoprotein reductase n=1 Tax=Gilvimarinus xylanilyticus TaxID=2944139 RepID=A0A9X2I0P7_9GAMM|nr:sulfite reductase flavoprotein subunit alpha [Gilvimarinus xylanilyticus]MCP8898493.1 sulfite reductase flavoprotein subunit alpha [Gilvimarinus xylanilyticus]